MGWTTGAVEPCHFFLGLLFTFFYITLIHFYYPQNGFLSYKVEWVPAKNFSTPFDAPRKAKSKRVVLSGTPPNLEIRKNDNNDS